ncbi:hypothetical protein SAMN05444007_11314 [Cribrihabitans marinus]|uniref:Uncharacterized protein n=2 Tax=Cribrihabitans marinus TaxID=1227549 RepID=A0A1H7DQZ7_9RHOB|nr:hypothetical protein GCM10010973_35700 [Cribrihabitans marinus]SEK04179.1 hypothetical protein SAMN05444007_11314 [Cribrihabitans marinus]
MKGITMRGWIAGQIVALVGALGVSGMARAQAPDSSAFTSQAQAENYLRENPTGPLAKAAFLAIVEFQLARQNPGFSRVDIARGVNLKAASGSPAGAGEANAGNDRDGGGDLY